MLDKPITSDNSENSLRLSLEMSPTLCKNISAARHSACVSWVSLAYWCSDLTSACTKTR